MIDQLLGRPNPTYKRTQVLLLIFFWIWRLRKGHSEGPNFLGFRRINRGFRRFTPWQVIVGLCTVLYTARNFDTLLGLDSPEPLARLYSRSYYRATWLVTGLDAGFATAMSIRPKWLRDICSVLFSVYYIIYANKGDEKLRRFRAVCTVEMLRTTWEKTSNPYIRLLNFWDRPSIGILKRVVLPRPPDSSSKKPIVAYLFFDGTEVELSQASSLVLDLPGGGFICMSPRNHEERLRRWAIRCKRPVLSIDYRKAPEYPFPFALDECFDVYQTIVNTNGICLGMSGSKLDIVLTGDSAGANIAVSMMYKILEHPLPLPRPVAIALAYAALDFNFTSWMSPANLRVMRAEQSTTNLAGLAEQKDHFSHKSPLSVVNDVRRWRKRGKSSSSLENTRASLFRRKSNPFTDAMRGEGDGNIADEEDAEEEEEEEVQERDKPISKRVMFSEFNQVHEPEGKPVIGTRLTMTSRTGYFQDRVISPSMMHAMAILYMGPHSNPDFGTDYYVSPILGPRELLAEFPPVLLTCGEKDPFVDDTVVFAGRLREAKEGQRRGPGEEEWVRVAIIEGWSHGFLQMSTIMPEAREAINGIADWMNEAFAQQHRDGRGAGVRAEEAQGGIAQQVVGRDADWATVAGEGTGIFWAGCDVTRASGF
ncbi:hypothetical protein M422DRAFT_74669 [Sphaerobolus stellatus SS14]|nr:hypothetical protein M422DRAFT_74669 [Sphaerobolus stellatus SS14]